MFIGLIILLIGGYYLFQVLFPGLNFDYNYLWPSVLIVLPIYFMLRKRKIDFGNLIIVFIGAWWLLVRMNIINGVLYKLFWPIIIILFGLFIIISSLSAKKYTYNYKKSKSENDEKDKIYESSYKDAKGMLNFYGVFGDCKEKLSAEKFIGSNVYAVFGGANIDFSNIKVENESAVINIYSIFGSSKITIPSDIELFYSSTAVFGGNENHAAKSNINKNSKKIYVNCISVFGRTEIK